MLPAVPTHPALINSTQLMLPLPPPWGLLHGEALGSPPHWPHWLCRLPAMGAPDRRPRLSELCILKCDVGDSVE